MSEPLHLVAEVCLAHRDAYCKACDEFNDDLWVHPCDLEDPELTLVRLWRGTDTELPNAFVAWDAGKFTIPIDHLMAFELWRGSLTDYRFSVASTDELLWVIDRIEQKELTGLLHVFCKPYIEHLRGCIVSDEYLVWAWLEAEKQAQR